MTAKKHKKQQYEKIRSTDPEKFDFYMMVYGNVFYSLPDMKILSPKEVNEKLNKKQ